MKGLVFALLLALAPLQAFAQTRPDIIVIMTDDQTVADLAGMKNVQRLLVAEGVSFANSFTDYPLCCSSRATFLTGQAAHNHQILGNNSRGDGGYEKFQALGESETLPVWLQRAGYTTFHFGKYMNGYGGPSPDAVLANLHRPPGWNQWFGRVKYTADRVYDYDVNENGVIVQYACNTTDYETDVISRKSVNFIRTRASSSQPLFMWIAPLAPHTAIFGECSNFKHALGAKPAERHRGTINPDTINLPRNFNEGDTLDKPSAVRSLPLMGQFEVRQARKRIVNRREALVAVDQMVERLYDELAAAERKACLIFTSDNGYLTGEHRVPTGKMLPYEESIRVPLVISCPGFPAGVTRTQLVNNTDLVATILELAGAIPEERELDGRSLVPLMLDPTTPWREAILFQGNIPAKLGVDNEDGPAPLVRYQGVRTKDAKYVEYTNGEKEFYYLKNDPVENYNRAEDPNAFPQLRSSMDQALDILRLCVGNDCWMPAMPPPQKR